MTTTLDKELKRQVTIDDADYVVAIDPDGIRLTGKGKRRPELTLRWRDLLSGEAALAVALNASLATRKTPVDAEEAGLTAVKKASPASRKSRQTTGRRP